MKKTQKTWEERQMDKELKQQIITTYATHEGDTGSSEVQIAILTERINHLNEHLKINKKAAGRLKDLADLENLP